MQKLKGLLVFFCLAALLISGCMAEAQAPAQEAAREPLLPIDFSFGAMPLKQNFDTDGKTYWHYEDPTITVHITTDRIKKGNFGCAYWVADVKLQDASQMRTLSDKGFDKISRVQGLSLASRAHPVLAINGDFYCYTGAPFVLRQGRVYVDLLLGELDVLAVDEDGDFHAYHKPRMGDIPFVTEDGQKVYQADGKRIINAFYFGPILVENGQAVEHIERRSDMDVNASRQRMAICQAGPLEYKCICCAGPSRGNEGMTLREFADLCARQNVQVAYNLDGGDSTMLIFDGKRVNDALDSSNRVVGDIIYFASAYQGE